MKPNFPNTSAAIATRVTPIAAPTLTTARQIGQVDCCALWASGGSVSAGSLIQSSVAICGATGLAACASGVTLTGAGVMSFAIRMEAKDARLYKNRTASFQIAVAHDVGSSVNYVMIIKKANSVDNFGAMTTIATSGVTAVTTSTGTVLKFENQALGDVSTGMEIEVQAACGAVTNKNFDFTEWNIEVGSTATAFVGNPYAEDLAFCQRYLPSIVAPALYEIMADGQCITTSTGYFNYKYITQPRTPPTSISFAGSAPSLFSCLGAAGAALQFTALYFISAGQRTVTLGFTIGSASLVAGNTTLCFANSYPLSAILFLGAELF